MPLKIFFYWDTLYEAKVYHFAKKLRERSEIPQNTGIMHFCPHDVYFLN